MENKSIWASLFETALNALVKNKPAIQKAVTQAAVGQMKKDDKEVVVSAASKNQLTVDQWATSCGRYAARKDSAELTQEVKDSATDLLARVAAFLDEIGWNKKLDIASGFRTTESNAKTAGAAKKSSHMTGKAVDLLDDKEQTLAKKVESNPELLRKHGLMMEDKTSTVGKNTNWCHVDTAVRADRPSRTFKP